jgi:hypothetical protein
VIRIDKLVEAKIVGSDGTKRTYQEHLDDSGDRIVGPLEYLQDLVLEYNGMLLRSTQAAIARQGHLLDLMMFRAGWWMTNNPPRSSYGNHQTNVKRWEALADLLDQVRVEMAKVGARSLSGPTDFKTIDGDRRSYWLERCDPEHRPGWVLSKYYEEWIHESYKTGDFYEWVTDEKGSGSSSVEYMNKARRANFEIRIVGSSVLDSDGKPFDTRNMSTCFSGKGWAIFVCSFKNRKIYAGPHIEGEFHHSTFLRGQAVLAAGEMCVDQGKIKIISAKSGHYLPGPEEMKAFLQTAPSWGGAMIYPDFKTTPPKLFPCRTFREEGMAARPVGKTAVLRTVPKWAQNSYTKKWLDKIEMSPS